MGNDAGAVEKVPEEWLFGARKTPVSMNVVAFMNISRQVIFLFIARLVAKQI